MVVKTFSEKLVQLTTRLPIGCIKKILVFNEINSTNLKAKDLARAGMEEGTVIIAGRQTQGRGRFDRRWESPDGGLYLSIIVRPKVSAEKTSLLSFVAALAVQQTLAAYHLDAIIKWPNDVRVRKKKIAGILLESEGEGLEVSFLVIGVGININTLPSKLPQELRPYSTSVKSELKISLDYQEFLIKFFHHFDTYYQLFLHKEYDRILSEWKNCSDTLGKEVQITSAGGLQQGTAIDVDARGFLILQTKQGTSLTITTGDCIYLNEL